jgi:hypothetical protein
MKENKVASKKWWAIAKQARQKLEDQIGKSVITWENFLSAKKKKSKKD